MLEKHYSHLNSFDVIELFQRSEKRKMELKKKHQELNQKIQDVEGNQIKMSKKQLKELLEQLVDEID